MCAHTLKKQVCVPNCVRGLFLQRTPTFGNYFFRVRFIPSITGDRLAMTPREFALSAADAQTWDLVRRLIGREELALSIAKTLANDTGSKVEVEAVAELFGITKESAYNKISETRPLK
jgi:hypothetical protein